jgi:hypothetical protein
MTKAVETIIQAVSPEFRPSAARAEDVKAAEENSTGKKSFCSFIPSILPEIYDTVLLGKTGFPCLLKSTARSVPRMTLYLFYVKIQVVI